MSKSVTLLRKLSGRYYVIGLVAATMILAGLCRAHTTTGGSDKSMTSARLPAPAIGASPLLQILQKRHTSREFANKRLDAQTIANLLWAAFGVNRPNGGRTAPSAHDWQYIDIYVSDSDGLYKYDAKANALELVKAGDIRAKTGLQDFAATAPFNLVYVADERKNLASLDAETRLLFAAATTGAIVQNVYLFCAANSLNTGVRADIDRPTLHKAMGLANEQKILLAQSVGYATIMGALKQGAKAMLSR